jgi:regulation of enolase protein 1 (concanavalin A-like superfamily)
MWKLRTCLVIGLLAQVLIQGKAAFGAYSPLSDPALLGWWTFDEGSGTVAHDSSSSGNDGTINGAATWVAGVYGTALNFNGSDAYVSTGQGLLNNLPGFTMACWVNAQNFTTNRVGLVGQNDCLEFGFNGGGDLRCWSAGVGGNVTIRYPHAYPSWHHVAAVGGPTGLLLFIDGQQVAGPSAAPAGTYGSSTYTVNIGGGGIYDATGNWYQGQMDDVTIFSRALSPEELQAIMLGLATPGAAASPGPDDGATDVPRDTSLRWTAGEFAATHDVYLGTVLADVNDAGRTVPGTALVSRDQTGTSYQPPDPLEYGQTYYWRVDEVNAPPDSTIVTGTLWSFTVEPYGYPIKPVAATASSFQTGMGPERTIDGSGLTGDLHGTEATTMWLSAGVQPNWIQYEFDQSYKLHDLQVWNSNQLVEAFLGFSAKKVTIETSLDGTMWTPVADVPEFNRALGAPDYAANTTVSLGEAEAKYVKLTINSTWGGVAPQAGLAEVRFSYVPVRARLPQPADTATDIGVDTNLDWRPGREATSHKLFFGTDSSAVANGTAQAETVTDHSYLPAALDFGTTYYWKVDEIGAATYPGDVWSFTTQEYAVVDDFESYTDQPGEEIFSAWIDGFTNGLSGSTVGYFTASGGTFGETTIIHGGKQSMPLQYDNTIAPFFSEAERTFASAQNWTGNGADSLVVYFRGLAPAFAETASGSILMNAIGTDIWGTADQFRYAYRSLNGNGSMAVRVDSLVNSNAWAKAGVMIRQSIDPGSVHAFTAVTPGNSCAFQRRPTMGAASTSDNWVGTAAVTAPYWVRITRTGNVFRAETSPDGQNWMVQGTDQTIPMTDPVLIGLALTSHDAAVATSTAFSNLSSTGNVTGTWQVAQIGATQPEGNSVEGLYLAVKDISGKSKVVQHPDPAATAYMTWQAWTIPLSEFTSAGVKMTAVKSLTLGVGNKAALKAGGTGTVYIDDIGYGKPAK